MFDEIKEFIIDNNILYPRYNRNIARRKYWDKFNNGWAEFIFDRFEEMKNEYSITFSDFLRKYFFDDAPKNQVVKKYKNAEEFVKYTKKVQINSNTTDYDKYYQDAKKLINFEPLNFTEIIYCYRNNIKNRPSCTECDNETEFTIFKKGYRKFCSQKCQIKYNNKNKEINESHLEDSEIRKLIHNIAPDLRNLTNIEIASNYINIERYSKQIKNLAVRERIYLFMNELPLNYIYCEHCGNKKKLISQVQGYHKSCGRNSCKNIERNPNYYDENSLNIQRGKGGKSYENGFLYLMYSESMSIYKIGISQDPVSRLQTLRNYIPDLIIFDCYFLKNNLTIIEKYFHDIFKSKNISLNENFGGYTEFFNLTNDDLNLIKTYIYDCTK